LFRLPDLKRNCATQNKDLRVPRSRRGRGQQIP